VTWQDQLRQLDQELAAGQISADEYRRRRDDLLAQAQRDQDQAQQQEQGPSDSGEGQQQGPFPPPFRWEASTPDSTQVMRPVQDPGPDTSAETTQVVPGGDTGSEPTERVDPASEPTHVVNPSSQPTQRVDPASEPTHVVNPGAQRDPERTQVVPGPNSGPFPQQQYPGQQGYPGQPFPGQQGYPGQPQYPGQQSYPGGQPYPGQQCYPGQQAGWPQQAQQEDAAPPWAGADLPPLDSSASWIKQGPEVFDEGSRSNTGKIIGAAAAVVLLLAVAFGAYWFWGRGQTGGSQAATNTAPSATSAAKPKEPTDIADVGGQKESHSDIRTFADVQAKIPYLTPDEQQVYQVAGAGKVQFLVSHLKDGAAVVILTVQAGNNQSAQTAVQNLAQLQTSYGMQPVPDAPAGVVAAEVGGNGQPAKFRGHYAYQGAVIRVEVTATGAGGPGVDVVGKDFQEVLSKQLTLSPANA
jgi:hypothetical protein